MLTRLEVDGFKNLLGFTADLNSFTCIAGPNAVGKSNMFDAIVLLSALADQNVSDALAGIRANDADRSAPARLFWDAQPPGTARMQLAAEMTVADTVASDLGETVAVPHTRLRYEIDIEIREHAPERKRRELVIAREAVLALGPTSSALTTPLLEHTKATTRTVVGTATRADEPVLLAIRREMQRWQVLSLNPAALRRPESAFGASRLGSDGDHLPAVLLRLRETDPDAFAAVAASLSALTDVRQIDVEHDTNREVLTLLAAAGDGPLLPARELSDGTLRFLALCTLLHDPEATGLYAIEEPENGIHPGSIEAMDELLHLLAHDPALPPGPDNPWRQVVINTHSGALIELQAPDDVLVAVRSRVRRNGTAASTMRLAPLQGTDRAERADLSLGPAALTDYHGRTR
ncbi:AAA family ATPase [Myceligenerans crystallogenes]|uniref:AAA family ATPase n=1 Tax=Myceligenerans crystallogenes TaxID=316335 RepID=A0ABN2NMM3_9MICO